MGFNDWNGDNKHSFDDDYIDLMIYKNVMENNNKPASSNKYDYMYDEKYQRRLKIVRRIVFVEFAVIPPIFTIIGLIEGPQYYFNNFMRLFFAVIMVVEIIALLVFLIKRISKKRHE